MTTELKNILGSLELKVQKKKSEWDASPVKCNHSFFDLATQELVTHLFSSYPHDWAYYVAGSWGKKKLKPHSDQDHFLFTSAPFTSEESNHYRTGLMIIEKFLESCGLPTCEGGVMASRPEWQFNTHEFRIDEVLPNRLATVEKADILYHSRILAGSKDLKSPQIKTYFYSLRYRKLNLSYLIFTVCRLFFAFSRKSQSELIKRIAYIEATFHETIGIEGEPLPVTVSSGYFGSVRIGLISLRKALLQYQNLFLR